MDNNSEITIKDVFEKIDAIQPQIVSSITIIINEKIGEVNKAIAGLNGRIDELSLRVDTLATITNDRFDKLEEKVEGLEVSFVSFREETLDSFEAVHRKIDKNQKGFFLKTA